MASYGLCILKVFLESEYIDDCEGDNAKLFQVASGLLHRKCEICLPPHIDPKDIADWFVNYFSSKIE